MQVFTLKSNDKFETPAHHWQPVIELETALLYIFLAFFYITLIENT